MREQTEAAPPRSSLPLSGSRLPLIVSSAKARQDSLTRLSHAYSFVEYGERLVWTISQAAAVSCRICRR